MTENEILTEFLWTKDPELTKQFIQLDSVNNLNTDPKAVRFAGHKAAQRAFVLGYRLAEELLVEACRELVAGDIVMKVVREEHGLPHIERPITVKLREIIIEMENHETGT